MASNRYAVKQRRDRILGNSYTILHQDGTDHPTLGDRPHGIAARLHGKSSKQCGRPWRVDELASWEISEAFPLHRMGEIKATRNSSNTRACIFVHLAHGLDDRGPILRKPLDDDTAVLQRGNCRWRREPACVHSRRVISTVTISAMASKPGDTDLPATDSMHVKAQRGCRTSHRQRDP